MKLHGSLTSPYVRKARVLVQEKDIPCEFVQVDAWAPDSPVPALNPLGKVPALSLDNGTVLYDSPVIVDYLDSLKTPRLMIDAGDARWIQLRWHALADGIMEAAASRFLESRRPAAQQSPEHIKRQEEKIARAIDFVASQVSDSPWLMQNRFSLADLVVAVALEYTDFRFPHDWRARRPKLGSWLSAITARPSFVDTRPPGFIPK